MRKQCVYLSPFASALTQIHLCTYSQFLKEDVVWSYLAQMTRALDACHNGMPVSPEAGGQGMTTPLLHRDLKPENVFLDAKNNVKLGDFGLSKQIGASHDFASTYVGTPYYMSPELATGSSYDAKSDVWALGCILYELCALKPPFDATSQAELTIKIKSGQVPSLSRRYSRDLEEVVRSMLQLLPRKRPSTTDLLEHPRVLFATQAIDLQIVRDSVAADQERVTREIARLAEWEGSLSRREASLEHLSSSNSRADLLAKQAAQLQQDREEFENHQRTIAQQWTERMQQLAAAEASLAEEKVEFQAARDLWISSQEKALKEGPSSKPPRLAECRRATDSSFLRSPPSARTAARPSMGVRRISASGDVSMEGTSHRAIKMTVTGRLNQARRAHSDGAQASKDVGEEEWYDTPAEHDDPQASSSAHLPHDGIQSRPLLRSAHTAPAKSASKPLAAGGVARLLGRDKFNALADRSDISMRDASAWEDDKENEASRSALPSPTLLKFKPRGSIVQRARQLTESRDQEEGRAIGGSTAEQQQGSDQDGSDEHKPRDDRRLQRKLPVGVAPVALAKFSPARPAIYDISNDSDLPSPFLRKQTRSLPGKVLIPSATVPKAEEKRQAENSPAVASVGLFPYRSATTNAIRDTRDGATHVDELGQIVTIPATSHRSVASTMAGAASSSAATSGSSRAGRPALKACRSTAALSAPRPSTSATGLPAKARPSATPVGEGTTGQLARNPYSSGNGGSSNSSSSSSSSSIRGGEARRPRASNGVSTTLASTAKPPASSTCASAPFALGHRRKSHVSLRPAVAAE